ncbi:MAG: GNAT family N-acetyltransferase [Solirubrobacterales bacterium]|nr:GNAT family N-acetyltransferase [Solirubrobacterales bacterium]
MKALRPSITDERTFVEHVDGVLRPAGYRMIGAFDDDSEGGETDEPPTAVSGFRVSHNFAYGHYLYVEDTSTLPAARGKGHARGLLDWLAEEAQRGGCAEMHLSSGVGENRASAHRLYFNAGLRIVAYHFARTFP